MLSRPAQITRTLTPFEKAFFFYQRRLNERLALPFTRYFYFKKDSPADVEWKRKFKARQTPARDIGVYNAYSKEGWNDELLLGAKESEPEEQIEALLRDAEGGVDEEVVGSGTGRREVERPMPRITEADRQGDLRSLDRRLEEELYLLVCVKGDGVEGKKGKEYWQFPTALLESRENLHNVSASPRLYVTLAIYIQNSRLTAPSPHRRLQNASSSKQAA